MSYLHGFWIYALLINVIASWLFIPLFGSRVFQFFQEDYVAWVCDQDAYACSGQKCSAQSILFMHKVNLSLFQMKLM